jgi:hypothetical protein
MYVCFLQLQPQAVLFSVDNMYINGLTEGYEVFWLELRRRCEETKQG